MAALFLAACGTAVAGGGWPGLTSGGDSVVYLAHGTAVTAIDIAEQRAVWSFPQEPNPRLLFYAPPAVSEEQAVFGDFGMPGGMFSPRVTVSIYSLDITGQDSRPAVNWTAPQVAQDRIIAAPLQVADRVFIGTADNQVLALDAADGRPLWPAPFEAQNSIWGQPTYEDGVLYVGSLDSNLYALDAESGTEIWRAELGGAIASKAILDDEVVYVSSLDEDVHAVDKQTGEIRWSASAQAAIWGAPALVDGVLYYADLAGNVYAADATTGEPRWPAPAKVAGSVVAAPTVADGFVYVATAGDPALPADERQGALYRLSAQDGTETWPTPAAVGRPIFTAPIVVDRSVVVALDSSVATPNMPLLVVLDVEDGQQVWAYTPPAVS